MVSGPLYVLNGEITALTRTKVRVTPAPAFSTTVA